MPIEPIDTTKELDQARMEKTKAEKARAREERAEAAAEEENEQARQLEEHRGKKVDVEA